MKKKKLTKREIDEALGGLSRNDIILRQELLETRQIFALYLEHKGETESFNKFVKAKAEEFEQQRSGNKEGA